MEDELTMAFQGVMKKVMCMLRVEDATTAATSSSTQGPKRSVVGSNNDINVLNQSLLFVDVIRERTPKVSFTINGREHHIEYYLDDGIYIPPDRYS
jgi:hypothetical protein